MKRMIIFLFSAILIAALTACGPAPASPTATLTPTERPTATSTYTPSPTATATPTNTPELFEVSFQAFRDYNGNGKMDEEEPALEGIVNSTSGKSCTTDADGTCKIAGVPASTYKVTFDPIAYP